MKSSASLGFAALLAASLAGKLAANVAPPGPDPRLFDAAAAAMLREAGFAVSTERRGFGTLLIARRPACAVIVAEYDPHGTFAERHRELAAALGPLRYAWRGRVFDDVPKVAALTSFYVWRELRRVGVAAPRAPLAAWAAAPRCDISRIDWRRLASLPA
ncbi:MAG: hypothetical protein JO013_02870 [Alphaproteobacteria bacterium]|nr:hypothetical protein [Alphaproteobacteria bacterium]